MLSDYFFKADAINHYRIEIEGDALEVLERSEHQSKEVELKRRIIFDEDHPLSILDCKFIDQLEAMGFTKHRLSSFQLTQVQSIFRLKQIQSIEPSYCGAVFRDVLVFYMNDQITGIAKLCFSCGHHVITGTTLNTASFGQQLDYKLLMKLLKI